MQAAMKSTCFLAFVCLLASISALTDVDAFVTDSKSLPCTMSLIPFFGGRGSSLFDPFSLTSAWDPFDFGTSVGGQDQGAITPQQSIAKDVSAVLNTRVDWLETPDAHIIKADLPGLSKDEVKVEIEDGRVLKISGERAKENVEDNDRWHRVERVYGRFVRRFRLPENAKLDEIQAKVENGVLEIRIPKVQEQKSETRAVDVK